jgi:hypothetical protein
VLTKHVAQLYLANIIVLPKKGVGAWLLLLVPPNTLVGLKAFPHCWESKPEEIPLTKPKIAHVFRHVVVV